MLCFPVKNNHILTNPMCSFLTQRGRHHVLSEDKRFLILLRSTVAHVASVWDYHRQIRFLRRIIFAKRAISRFDFAFNLFLGITFTVRDSFQSTYSVSCPHNSRIQVRGLCYVMYISLHIHTLTLMRATIC